MHRARLRGDDAHGGRIGVVVLVDAVRGVGALVGICGALIVAPKALPVLVRIWVRPAWRAVRAHLPGHHHPPSATAMAGVAEMTIGVATAAIGTVWARQAPRSRI